MSTSVGTPVSVRINSQYTGNPVFKVSPNGGILWYNANTNEEVLFTNVGADLRVRIEAQGDGNTITVISNYSLEVLKYYSGDLIVDTNSSFASSVGSNFISSTPGAQIISNIVFSDGVNKTVYYIKLHNSGNTNGTFYLYLTPSGWSVNIFDQNNNNITSQIISGSYSVAILSNSSTNFRVEVSIPSSAADREYQDFNLYSSAIAGGYVHDSVVLRAISWKYLPDAVISNSSGLIGNGIWEISPNNQTLTNIVNSRFSGYETIVTNYVIITNRGIQPDVVRITNLFYTTSGSVSDWNIDVYNVSDNQSVSSYPYNINLNIGQSKVLRVIVSPKTNAPANSYLNLEFFMLSTNAYYTIIGDPNVYYDDLRKDSVRFVFENHKYQPDLVVSTNIYFLGGVGNNNYVSTNTSLTQSIMVRTVNNQSLTYYFKLQNDGLEGDTIYLKSFGITNGGWSEEYYDINSNNITSLLTNGTNVLLNLGGEFIFRGVFTPDSTVDSGVEPWVKVIAYTTNFTNAYDVVYARPRNIKVRPDALVGYNLSSMGGDNIYNSTGSNQYISNVLRKGGIESTTNFVIIQNDSTTDPDIINIVGDSSTANWFIKYLDVNDNDITTSIVNTTNLTLPLGSSITLKIVSYPQSSAADDEWIGIKVRTYSSYVLSQEDVVVISNRALSIKPDIGVFSLSSGWIDIPTISSTYEGQASISNKIIAGQTNMIKIKLRNDTGSIQEYVFKVNVSNVGGSESDWMYSFKSIIGGTTNDITTNVTNGGWTNLYSANQDVEVLAYVMLTNAVENDITTTNGAVSNELYLKYDFVNVFRSNIVDKGMHSFIVARGLPDIYHEYLLEGADIITNEFSSNVFLQYGITKNYPRDDIVLKLKNAGVFIDVFRVFVAISNGNQPGNELTNWVFKFLDGNTNDITSLITNTNVGWTNIITNGYEKILRMQIVNSNGYVNDNIFFYVYFETITKERRLDVAWYEVMITPGLPDVAISNIFTGIIRGTNQFASDSSDYQKIETNETGRYNIVLRNIAPIEGYPNFRLKAFIYGNISEFDIYHTNKSGSYVSLSTLTNQGYTNAISNYSAINGYPEDYLALYVVPKSTANSGNKVVIRYEFSLYDNPGVYDVVYVTNEVVKPKGVLLSLPSFSNSTTVYVGKYQSYSGSFILSNADSVWEEFIVKGVQSSSSGWIFKVYTNSTDISSEVFGSGFSTGVIGENGVMLLLFSVTNTNELVSGTTNIVQITARPKKNTNISSVLTINVVYVDAIADISVINQDENNSSIVGIGVIDGAITNKVELYETNVYKVFLSNAINAGGKVRFVVSVESNYSPAFGTFILSESSNDITSQVFNSNYIVELSAGESRFILVYRVLTNTNSLVDRGFHSYLRLSMKTVDVDNSIYDYIVLRDVVTSPEVDLRSAGAYDNIFSFTSYSDTGKHLKTFKNTPITVYLGVRNVDLVGERFFVKANG